MLRSRPLLPLLPALGLLLSTAPAAANGIPFATAQSHLYLLIGNGPVNDSTGQFTNKGVGDAVDVSNFELGANQNAVPSPSNPSLAGNVPALPAGITPVGVGIFGDGNIAVTHPGGTFQLSDVDLYADLGVQCAMASGCDSGSSTPSSTRPAIRSRPTASRRASTSACCWRS